jgi:predicted nucleic acid-binding protein
MLVVADSSPLIVLLKIDLIQVLPSLFETIVIPPQVAAELRSVDQLLPVRQFISSPPSWLFQRSPIALQSIPKLHAGETAAISLAKELNADLLLIDEAAGRKEAISQGIRITGTIGVLDLAARQGLIDLQSAFDCIKGTDFWVSQQLLDQTLKDYQTYLLKKRP